MLQEIFEDIKAVIGSRKYNGQKNNKIKTKNKFTKQKLDRKKCYPPHPTPSTGERVTRALKQNLFVLNNSSNGATCLPVIFVSLH